MLFNQFLDEDESELVAQQLQNEMYGAGGGAAAQSNNFGFDPIDPGVR
jgi:hypothetical protein